MDWEAQMEAEWEANGGLMGMVGMTGKYTIAHAQFVGMMGMTGELNL